MIPGISSAGLYGAFPPPPSFPNHSASTSALIFNFGTTLALPYPASVASGDLLIVHACMVGTPDLPSGWTDIGSTQTIAGSRRTRLYWRLALGTEGGTSLSVGGGSSGSMAAEMFRFDAGTINALQAPEAASATFASGVVPNPPSLSPSWGLNKNLWLALVARSGFTQSVTSYPLADRNVNNDQGAGGSCTVHTASCSGTSEVATLDPAAYAFNGYTIMESVAYTVAVRGA